MDVRDLLDPDLARLFARMPAATGPVDVAALAQQRGQARAFPGPALPAGVVFEDHQAPGDPDVTVRVYRPDPQPGPLGCVYWIHGGGYVGGSYDADTIRVGRLVSRVGCVVVSVQYRLAPQTPYPGPLDDCYAGLRWTHANASGLLIDPARIVIAGASAGGGLCAALALLARDRGEIPVTHQVLVYPMIDDRRTTPSSQWITHVWTRESNEMGWRAYLGDLFGGDVPAYAAASRATDLSGLPPAIVTVGALDLFVDEDVDYAQRLLQAGVPTELHVYPGAPHAFDSMGGAPIARQARRDVEDYIRKALDVPAVD